MTSLGAADKGSLDITLLSKYLLMTEEAHQEGFMSVELLYRLVQSKVLRDNSRRSEGIWEQLSARDKRNAKVLLILPYSSTKQTRYVLQSHHG